MYAREYSGFVGCVSKGMLRMQKSLKDGRQHIVGLLVDGDIFGQAFDEPLSFSIEAVTDSDICAVQRAPFEALLERSPELERVVMQNVLNELDRARDWMVILANPKIRARLAGFLLVLCTRFVGIDHLVRCDNGKLRVKIPISRTDLAHLLGTRPESLSRAFHALADEGTITLLRPDLVELIDMDALGAEAGDEETASYASVRKLSQLVNRHSS